MSVSNTDKTVFAKGLKGVVAAETSICDVNGGSGRLTYRGYDVDELAAASTFEEVAYLLLYGDLPTPFQLDEFRTALHRQMNLPEPVDEFLRRLPAEVSPMAALEAAVAYAGLYDTDGDSVAAAHRKAVRLIARLPTMVGAIGRLRAGEIPVAPDVNLPLASNFLWMLTGRLPTADEAQAMNLILILHAEHGLNASTFAARVITATLSDVYSAVTGAIGVLERPAAWWCEHGGAQNARGNRRRGTGGVLGGGGAGPQGKVHGFRPCGLQNKRPAGRASEGSFPPLGNRAGDTRLFDVSVELEKRVTAAIGKHCNVDFYSASVQDALGIAGEMFTCVFAASRIVGWCAHILEQLADNKIIRPAAEYVAQRTAATPPSRIADCDREFATCIRREAGEEIDRAAAEPGGPVCCVPTAHWLIRRTRGHAVARADRHDQDGRHAIGKRCSNSRNSRLLGGHARNIQGRGGDDIIIPNGPFQGPYAAGNRNHEGEQLRDWDQQQLRPISGAAFPALMPSAAVIEARQRSEVAHNADQHGQHGRCASLLI